jgi:hypothetical protein
MNVNYVRVYQLPEPSTLALLGTLALGAVGVMARRAWRKRVWPAIVDCRLRDWRSMIVR